MDAVAKPQEFDAYVKGRAQELVELSDRPKDARGIELTPLARTPIIQNGAERGYHYRYLDVELDPQRRTATFTVRAPESPGPTSIPAILEAGAAW